MRRAAAAALKMIPGTVQARLEYHLRGSGDLDSTALNGQQLRRHVVDAIISAPQVAQIVEAGTFKGATTAYFGQSGKPVIGLELTARFHLLSQLRTRHLPNVEVRRTDSVAGLRLLIDSGWASSILTFYYLDAHWYDNLPLVEEIQQVKRTEDYIILIDDFAVPEDPGYGFDDYGPGKRLDLGLVALLVAQGMDVYFPAHPSAKETGRRRGWVLLCAGTGGDLLRHLTQGQLKGALVRYEL